MIKWLILAVIAAVVSQVVRELLVIVAAKRGPALINRAAARLPENRCEIRREEWLAEFEWLAQRNAHFLSMEYAVGVWVGAVRIRRASQNSAEATTSKASWLRQHMPFAWMIPPAVHGSFIFAVLALFMAAGTASIGLAFAGSSVELIVRLLCFGLSAIYTVFALMALGRRLYLIRQSKRSR
jgi:hypothetical protein